MVEELLDFDAIEKNRYENMSFAKRIVLCSFTEIIFQRKLLSNEAFKAVRLKGIKLILFDADHDDAYENLVKLSKICDEIENEAIKTLRFLINFSEGEKERVGEVYEIHFAYGECITVSLKLGDSVEHIRYDSKTHKNDFRVFIMRLRQFCRMLRDLPDGSYGRYHVVYSSGKKMRENVCEYFTKIVRAPPVWKGAKQDICGIVGKFNGKEIGLKMSVGTLFGTGATDSTALAEHLKEENWEEGGWEEQRENTQKRFENVARHVSYNNDRFEVDHEDIVETHRQKNTDAFNWNDDFEASPVDNMLFTGDKEVQKTRRNEMKKKDRKKMDKEEKKEEEAKKNKKRPIQDKMKLALEEKCIITSDDGLEGGEYLSDDSAQRGSDINASTVMEISEEANEKEGRMEMRRNRRKRMMERKKDANDTLEYVDGVSLGDIEKAAQKTPGDSKSTTTSSGSIIKTPGMGTKNVKASK